jgi:hypothetical protein
MILSSMDELMRKRAQEILNRDKPVLEAQTNLDQQDKGVIPTVKNFLGLGDVLPEVKDAPQEYQDLRKSQLENKGFANSPFTKMIAGATTETYKDVALQPGTDEQNQKIIEQNNKLIDEISQKKKDHPEKADFYDKSIRNIQKNTQDLVSQIGGEIKDKTTGQLVGQSLSTGAELSQVIPIESLFSQGTKFLLKEGGEMTGKAVAKLLAENGLKEGTEDAGKFLLEKGITPAKETLLKGEKLLSAKGITNLATSKSVVENVIYGGVFGAGGALEEKKSPMEVLGSTETGMGLGFVAGSTLPGVISLVSRGLSKITKGVVGKFSGKVDKVAVEETAKDLEKAFGKTPNESDMAEIENAFAHGANRDEIVSHIKQAAEEPGIKVVPEPPVAETPKPGVTVKSEPTPGVEYTPVEKPKTPEPIIATQEPDINKSLVDKVNKDGSFSKVEFTDKKIKGTDAPTGVDPETKTFYINRDNLNGDIEHLMSGGKIETGTGAVIERLPNETDKDLKNRYYDSIINFEKQHTVPLSPEDKIKVESMTPREKSNFYDNRAVENPSAIPTVEGTGKVKTRKGSETLQRNLESQGIEGKKPEQYRQAVHSVRNPNADEFLKTNRELAKEVALGNAHVDGIIPEDVLAAVTRSGDKELIAEVATNTSLINDATEMGRRIEAWKQMNVDNPVRVISDVTKDRVKSVGEKKIAKTTEKLKVETKVKLKLETAQSLLDKLIC